MNKLWVIIMFLSYQASAQLEMANWRFGSKVALDFSDGPAVPVGNSELDTVESSSAISTNTGELLFYTDGVTVYNRNDLIMVNGEDLKGQLSSTNGVVIVPFPNNDQRYYIFTADAVQHYQGDDGEGAGMGVNYSIVDMSAASGLGAVIEKNINVLPQGSEKLTAVLNSDGTGYWVLTHHQDRFYAYPITAAGVGTPVITTLGISITNYNNIRGALKFSPDGSRVAVCHTLFEPGFAGQLALYDFNSATGVLSNETVLGTEIVYYGAEFSPNSQMLYATGKTSIDNGSNTGFTEFVQYDLQAANIAASRYLITTYLSSPLINLAGALQLAIDGKLYHSFGGLKLSVVRQPNRLGEASNFLFRAVNLGFRSASIGLPLGEQSYYENIIEYESLCQGEVTSFNLNTPRTVTSVLWNFGDLGSGGANTSTLSNPTHTFSTSGTFTITATVTFENGEVREYRLNVRSIVTPTLTPAVLTQCDVDGQNDGRTIFNLRDALELIILEDSTNDSNNLFLSFYETENDALLEQNAIVDPETYFSQANGQLIYVSIFTSLDCFKITTITLNVDPGLDIPDLDLTVCASSYGEVSAVVLVSSVLGGITNVYPDVEINIYATREDAGAQQNPILNSEVFEFSTENFIFFRLGSTNECIGIGKAILTILEPLELNDEEVTICSSENGNFLRGPLGYQSYTWSTGEITQDIQVEEAGIYVLEVSLFDGGCSDTIQYIVDQGAVLEAEITVNDFQQSNEILIDASLSEGTIFYSIDGGMTFTNSGTFSGLAPGDYEVVIRDEEGCNEIREIISVRGAPRFFTPNNDGYNDRWHIINATNYTGLKVNIFDRFGKQMASLTSESQGWDGTYNGKQLATNTYWYVIDYDGNTSYGYFTLVTRNL